MSPFELFFGRSANYNLHPMSDVGQKESSEVADSSSSEEVRNIVNNVHSIVTFIQYVE